MFLSIKNLFQFSALKKPLLLRSGSRSDLLALTFSACLIRYMLEHSSLGLKNEINNFMPCNGFIFDGFPRTTFQAKELDNLLLEKSLKIDLTIALEVDNNSLIKRLLERGKSSGRADDQSVEKINMRLKEYENKTKPLIDYYNYQNKFHFVNGIGSLDEITSRIEEVIEEFNND